MPDLAITDDTEPREIAAWLHELIAAQSPEHAALVAAFRLRSDTRVRPAADPPAFPRPPRRGPYAPRLERAALYAALRDAGAGKHVAAAQVPLSPRTADRYEARYLAAQGGGA